MVMMVTSETIAMRLRRRRRQASWPSETPLVVSDMLLEISPAVIVDIQLVHKRPLKPYVHIA